MLFPDSLSVTVSQRRCACVLDPALMLSPFGLPLLRRLDDVMDLWIVRELWHILDNSRLYLDDPTLLFQGSDDSVQASSLEPGTDEEVASAMREWERLRMESDLSGLKLFWLGDGLSESLVPAGAGPDLLWRFEALSCTLDRALRPASPMECACRDSAALAAALGNAFILTSLRTGKEPGRVEPALCSLLAKGGVPCMPLGDDEPMAGIERDYLCHLLVHAGAAKLVWAGLDLAVLHLVTPAAPSLPEAQPCATADGFTEISLDAVLENSRPGLWDKARAFWYPLASMGRETALPGDDARRASRHRKYG